jgi:exopolysaccharide production protein ExoQ
VATAIQYIISTSSRNIGLTKTLDLKRADSAAERWGTLRLPNRDFVIAVGLTASVLAVINLKTLGVALFVLLTCISLFVQRRNVFANHNVRFIAVILLLGMASTIWSLDPHSTLYYGGQTIITALAGMVLASSPKPFETLLGVALTLICHTLISHVFGEYVLWENGETVFVGIAGVKNYYGGIGGLTVLASMGLAYVAINRNARVIALIAMVGVLAGALGLVRSRATGFSLSTAACGMVIIYFNVYRVLTPRVRFGLMLYVAYALVCSAVGLLLVKDDLMRMVLHAVHKDVTLTGRTEIWEIAKAAISKRFWLGYGQDGFWNERNPYAQEIWRLHGLAPTRTFPLHNTYLEIRANIGVIGISTYLVVFGSLILRQIISILATPSAVNITWISIAFYFMFLMPVETFSISSMNYYSVFLVAALTLGKYGNLNPNINKQAERSSSKLSLEMAS